MNKISHIPVLMNEILEVLNPQRGGRYIDGTVNGGGHAKEILDRIGENGALLGIDRDGELINRLKKTFADRKNLIAICDSYARMNKSAPVYGFGSVNGILLDLGFSSYHVDESMRGFSFLRDEPLDMRYDTAETRLTAYTIVNKWSQQEIARIGKEYGEERFARHIAAGIVRERARKPIASTFELVDVIRKSIPARIRHGKIHPALSKSRTLDIDSPTAHVFSRGLISRGKGGIHPATRMFQAIRIAVNNELGELRSGLSIGIDLLVDGGRMAVISFHSLEDAIVKDIFRTKEKEGIVKILIKKPITATPEEVRMNPRARSAKLRAIIKVNQVP